MSEVEAAGNADEKKLGLDAMRQPADEAEGLSLDKLNRAFAAMLGAGDDPYTVPLEPDDDPIRSAIVVEEQQAVNIGGRSPVDAACEINPRSIVEVMLFVGTPDNRPLSARQIAGLMRGVRPAEVDELVADLNAGYAATGRPYRIVGEGAGYRFALAAEFEPIRDKFYGRIKHVRLSPPVTQVR